MFMVNNLSCILRRCLIRIENKEYNFLRWNVSEGSMTATVKQVKNWRQFFLFCFVFFFTWAPENTKK